MRLLLVLFVLMYSGLFAQSQKLDSIQIKKLIHFETRLDELHDSVPFNDQELLKEAKQFISGFDSEEQKVQGWLWVADGLGHNELYTLANIGYDRALHQAKQLGDPKMVAMVYFKRARIMSRSILIEEARALLDTGLKVLDGTEPELEARIRKFKGRLLSEHELYEEAMTEYLVAEKYYEENNIVNVDYLGLSRFIGSVFKAMREYDKALEYYDRMTDLAIEMELPGEEGESWLVKGDLFGRMDDAERAMEAYLKALAIFTEMNDPNQIGLDYNEMIAGLYARVASEYIYMDDYEKAKGFLDKADAMDKKYKYFLECPIARYYAKYFSHVGEYKKALEYVEKAREIARTGNSSNARYLVDVHDTEAWVHYENGYYKEGYHALEDYIDAKFDLVSDDNRQFVLELETKYETEKKQREIALLNKDKQLDKLALDASKQRTTALSVGLLFLIAAALLAWNRYRVIKKQKNVIVQQKQEVEEQKQVSEELLLNILPEEVAKELKAKGSAEAQLIDQVTVLFTDFKGFTALSEQLAPRELVRDIHECFSAFDHIMEMYGIEKIKTIGDAYMAAGGLPTPNSSHALDVMNAALEIKAFMEEGKARKMAEGLPFFEIRIGVHTGPVVAGIVGVKKFQYDIWGDTVNTASRMESSGEVGQVNISEATYELVKDNSEFDFTSRGKVEAKGKGVLEMYFVTGSFESRI